MEVGVIVGPVLFLCFANTLQIIFSTNAKTYLKKHSFKLVLFCAIEYEDVPVSSFELEQNYPNPFNSSTIISFTIPGSGNVLLDVYNLLGEKIETLINELVNEGKHSVHFEAEDLASGIYFYVLKATKHTQTKKMLLIR